MSLFAFFGQKRGNASIETALLLLPFLVLVTVFIEILLVIYYSVALEFINANAAQYASTFSYTQGYASKYDEMLQKQRRSFGFFLTDGSYEATLHYCHNIEEFSQSACQGSNDDHKIIVYELAYQVKTIFLYNWLEKPKFLHSRLAYLSERSKPKEE